MGWWELEISNAGSISFEEVCFKGEQSYGKVAHGASRVEKKFWLSGRNGLFISWLEWSNIEQRTDDAGEKKDNFWSVVPEY